MMTTTGGGLPQEIGSETDTEIEKELIQEKENGKKIDLEINIEIHGSESVTHIIILIERDTELSEKSPGIEIGGEIVPLVTGNQGKGQEKRKLKETIGEDWREKYHVSQKKKSELNQLIEEDKKTRKKEKRTS